MKKLLLTSSFAKVKSELIPLLNKDPRDCRIAFIPTAADTHENKWFVEDYRKAFADLGCITTDVQLHNTTEETLQKVLQNVDVIFVGGGNTFYLLQHARNSGFTKLMPKLIEKGVIYVGSSAGSYIACPTIEMANWKQQNKNIVGLTDLTGMNLVPFLLSVHYKPEYKESLVAGKSKTSLPLRILTDEQAIAVVDDEIKLVGTGEEVFL